MELKEKMKQIQKSSMKFERSLSLVFIEEAAKIGKMRWSLKSTSCRHFFWSQRKKFKNKSRNVGKMSVKQEKDLVTFNTPYGENVTEIFGSAVGN
jgi:hypothetical protein